MMPEPLTKVTAESFPFSSSKRSIGRNEYPDISMPSRPLSRPSALSWPMIVAIGSSVSR